ncbi:hypothetical protein INT43_006687 [Umbelopsis isabellina]|uniref:Uncharacterized protein n=1 Tax=Mortierella isabellina TaxID=91625 RepID=A0A8H7Q264_MORIS|nr:hypothetical protein INT43_006687 [Umbelopsis isabellina]
MNSIDGSAKHAANLVINNSTSQCSNSSSIKMSPPPSANQQYRDISPHFLPSNSSDDTPFDIPVTPPIPNDSQLEAITDKILQLNINHQHARDMIKSGNTPTPSILSRHLQNDDGIIDFSASPVTQEWPSLEEQLLSFHSEQDSLINHIPYPPFPENWEADQLDSLQNYLSHSLIDEREDCISLPQDHPASWLNAANKPANKNRHILPLPVPKWRTKRLNPQGKSSSANLGATNCIASPDRAAQIVLASMRAGQIKAGVASMVEQEITSVSVNDLAPHRDKIKKLKRTIGSDELKSDVEERRLQSASRRRLRHQQRFKRQNDALNREEVQGIQEVRLPESAFDFSCPFPSKSPRMPSRTSNISTSKSSIGLTKCLETITIPYQYYNYINRLPHQSASRADRIGISTAAVGPPPPPPSQHRQKDPSQASRKGTRSLRQPSSDPSDTPAGTSRPRRSKKVSNAPRPTNYKDHHEPSRSSKAVDILPATSFLFDNGTSDDWMCFFCEFEVFVRGFVAARRKGGWYKRRRERTRRLREIEARQNNELLSSSGSDLDDGEPI